MKNINIDGEDYELDVVKAIDARALTKKYKLDKSQILPGSVWKSPTYRTILIVLIGDKYSILCFDSAMLCEAFHKSVVSERFSLEEIIKYLESRKYSFHAMIKPI